MALMKEFVAALQQQCAQERGEIAQKMVDGKMGDHEEYKLNEGIAKGLSMASSMAANLLTRQLLADDDEKLPEMPGAPSGKRPRKPGKGGDDE